MAKAPGYDGQTAGFPDGKGWGLPHSQKGFFHYCSLSLSYFLTISNLDIGFPSLIFAV